MLLHDPIAQTSSCYLRNKKTNKNNQLRLAAILLCDAGRDHHDAQTNEETGGGGKRIHDSQIKCSVWWGGGKMANYLHATRARCGHG